MIGTGTFEVEIDGKKIGFKFGMVAASVTEQIAGGSIVKMFKEIAEKHNVITNLLHYFYGGAVAYARKNKLEEPDQDEVGEYIEAMGFEKAMQMYYESLKGPETKNSLPPTV